tara:strand:- start:21770 stop:22762 length:993 start_codon:yes stop_codon:yes gene_type:complete
VPQTIKIKQLIILIILFSTLASCSNNDNESGKWEIVHEQLPAALTAIWGINSQDIWAVGGNTVDNKGSLILHFDGEKWERLYSNSDSDLWWIFGFAEGPIFFGGSKGLILKYFEGQFETMETPGDATVYGIWGTSENDLWAVGGNIINGAFAWRYNGEKWENAERFPAGLSRTQSLFKVWGENPEKVWLIGTNGKTIFFNGKDFIGQATKTQYPLFTIHGNNVSNPVIVGGLVKGVILENINGEWVDKSPKNTPHLMGIFSRNNQSYAVGINTSILRQINNEQWGEIQTGIKSEKGLHSIWIDEKGGVWTVGGNVLAPPLTEGIMLYRSP